MQLMNCIMFFDNHIIRFVLYNWHCTVHYSLYPNNIVFYVVCMLLWRGGGQVTLS